MSAKLAEMIFIKLGLIAYAADIIARASAIACIVMAGAMLALYMIAHELHKINEREDTP